MHGSSRAFQKSGPTRGSGCGVTALRIWSLGLNSNPASGTYQLGAPGRLISPLCASVSTAAKWNNREHVLGPV